MTDEIWAFLATVGEEGVVNVVLSMAHGCLGATLYIQVFQFFTIPSLVFFIYISDPKVHIFFHPLHLFMSGTIST